MLSMKSMIDWESLIYEGWAKILSPNGFRGKRNYHQNKPQGKHTLEEGDGKLILQTSIELFCLEYDKLVSSNFGNSKVLDREKCRRRCDYVLFSLQDRQLSLFVELTSDATADGANLDRIDPNTGLSKLQKVPEQLAHTIKSLCLESRIKDYIDNQATQRVAVCAVRLGVQSTSSQVIQKSMAPFNHVLKLQKAREGTIFDAPDLNELGFEYRRIEYPFELSL